MSDAGSKNPQEAAKAQAKAEKADKAAKRREVNARPDRSWHEGATHDRLQPAALRWRR